MAQMWFSGCADRTAIAIGSAPRDHWRVGRRGAWAVAQIPQEHVDRCDHGRFAQNLRHFATKMARSHEGKMAAGAACERWRRPAMVYDVGEVVV